MHTRVTQHNSYEYKVYFHTKKYTVDIVKKNIWVGNIALKQASLVVFAASVESVEIAQPVTFFFLRPLI